MRSVLLILVVALPSAGLAAPRVVVQEAHSTLGLSRYLRFSQDGTHVATVGGMWQQTLFVIDRKNERVLHRVHLPERAADYAFSADNKRMAVTTARGLFQLNMDTGEMTRLQEGAFTSVAVDATGEYIAVLGKPADTIMGPILPGQSLLVMEARSLRWKHLLPTHIIDAGDNPGSLTIHEGKVHALGVGGDLYSMLPSTYSVSVELDLKTGKSIVTRGPAQGRFGKGNPGFPVDKHLFPIPKELEEAGMVVKVVETFEPPPSLLTARKRWQVMAEKGIRRELVERFDPFKHGARRAVPMMNRIQGDTLELVLMASTGNPKKDMAVLSLNRKGEIKLRPTRHYTGGRLALKDLHHLRQHDFPFQIPSLNHEGPPLLDLDFGKARRELYFFDDGTLLTNGASIEFFPLGEKKPRWAVVPGFGDYYDIQCDAKEETLAVITRGATAFLRRKDGKVLGKMSVPLGTGYIVWQSLSPTGKQLAALLENELVIFEVPSGKRLSSQPVLKEARYPRVYGYSGGWVVSGSEKTFTFHPERGWSKPLPIREVRFVQEITIEGQSRLVLQAGFGRSALVDPGENRILTEWVAGDGSSSTDPPYNTIWPGVGIVRSLAVFGETDLLDARTGKVVVTIHAAAAKDGNVGFIAHTPDGFWTASSGAERYVEIFDNGRRLSVAEKEKRRSETILAERIQALGK